jgi:hypothetical protein
LCSRYRLLLTLPRTDNLPSTSSKEYNDAVKMFYIGLALYKLETTFALIPS